MGRLLLNSAANDAATYVVRNEAGGHALVFYTGGVNGKSRDDTAIGNLADFTETQDGTFTVWRVGLVSTLLATAQHGCYTLAGNRGED